MTHSINSGLDNAIKSLPENSKAHSGKLSQGVANGSDSREASSARPADKLELTAKAQALKALEEHVRQAPDVDKHRIAELKQALKDGTYEINPSRIADKLLALDSKLPE